jgi:phosphate transport system substrate-binding protein
MKKWLIGLIALVVVGGALFWASSNREKDNSASSTGSSSSKKTLSGTVLAVGSTALQPLAEQAGELFSAANSGVTITVQGGGSGAGLSQVQAGSVQIGDSDVFAEEKDGIDASKLVDHKVAVVGITPVVNSDVKVSNLTASQLKDIFTGKITNWKEVGGDDQTIVVINRASGSGTRAVFEKAILNGATAVQAQEQDSNGTVQKIVGTTPYSISYLAFGFAKADGLKTVSIDDVKPTTSNVESNDWKIWGYEHMYTNGEATGATKGFIDFFATKDAAKVIKQLGYIPLGGMQVEKSATGDVTKK